MRAVNYIATVFVLLFCTQTVSAQYNTGYNSSTESYNKSWDTNIAIHADPRLDVILEHHEYVRKNAKHTNKGYRVQIYYGTDRAEAINRKVDFIRHHPEIKVYMSYVQPKYRVKVGNFASRADAAELYREMIYRYGACMIVPDVVVLKGVDND